MLFYLKLLLAVVSAVLSVSWLLQVVLYMFTAPPISPFLNTFFITLDNVFPLFGTVAFTVFCFYLIGACSAQPPIWMTAEPTRSLGPQGGRKLVLFCVLSALQA